MNRYALKDSRKRLGLTAREMALKLNTPLRTYEGWEQGRSIPGVVESAVIFLESNNRLAKIIESAGLIPLLYSRN